MDEDSWIDGLDTGLESFEQSVGGAREVLAAFDAEIREMQSSVSSAGKNVSALSRSIGKDLKASFDDLIMGGKSLGDVMKGALDGIGRRAYRGAMSPLSEHVSSGLAGGLQGIMGNLLPFEKGAPFSQGRVVPFAKGGVVGGATTFPMRGGTGLMGEAGPEAIMPLTRGADGSLGVRSAGGGRPVSVVMNIQTPDAESFRRSQSQVAAQMERALSRGQRNR